MDARTRFVFWIALIGVFLRLLLAPVGQMIDPVAYIGLAFAILFPFLQWKYEKTPRWLTDIGIAFGCIILGVGVSPVIGKHLLVDTGEVPEARNSVPAAFAQSARIVVTYASAIPKDGIPSKPNYSPVITYQNQGQIASIGTVLFANLDIGVQGDDVESADKAFESLLKGARRVHIARDENQIQPGSILKIDQGSISYSSAMDVYNGEKPMRYFVVVKYSDSSLPDDKAWIAETCLVFTKNLDNGPCPEHNRIYQADN